MNRLTIKGDKVIWMIAILFSIASLLIVYSSTVTLANKQRTMTESYLFEQLIIMLLGLGMLFIAHNLRFTWYSRIGQILFALAVPLLIMTFFMAPDVNNAQRNLWLNLPVAGRLSFQPSDIAKLALMMYIARFLAKYNHREMEFKEFFIKMGLPLFLVTALILRSNFSTAAILFMVSILFLIIGQVKFKYVGKLVLIALTAFLLLLAIGRFVPELFPRAGTWVARIEGFFMTGENEEPNIQVKHAQYAIAQGGLIGKMPGKSTQRNFLPYAYNDYVYAIIVEEYGLVGGTTVVMLFMILLFRSIKIARRCRSKFGSFLVVGISLLMVWQALLNMAVAVNIMPITGQPLPFLSKGGTSFWFSCIGIGIILSVSRSVDLEPEPGFETEKQLNVAV